MNLYIECGQNAHLQYMYIKIIALLSLHRHYYRYQNRNVIDLVSTSLNVCYV
jgi:hypothetical protein